MPNLIAGNFGEWSPEIARQKALSQAAQRIGQVQGYMNKDVTVRPEFDYAQQANEARIKADTINQESSTNAANNVIVQNINDAIAQQQTPAQAALDAQAAALTSPVQGGTESPRISAYMRALRKTSALEPESDLPVRGQQEVDRYGMGTEVLQNKQGGDRGGWDRQALGRDISTEDFLNSKKLQNQIARYKFGKYLKRQGETGALTKWHEKTGNPLSLETFLSQVLAQMDKG